MTHSKIQMGGKVYSEQCDMYSAGVVYLQLVARFSTVCYSVLQRVAVCCVAMCFTVLRCHLTRMNASHHPHAYVGQRIDALDTAVRINS